MCSGNTQKDLPLELKNKAIELNSPAGTRLHSLWQRTGISYSPDAGTTISTELVGIGYSYSMKFFII